jgi:sortase A
VKKWLLAAVVILGLAEFGYGAWIPAKAWFSQVLLERAWQASIDTRQLQKPWPWADTFPLFKLQHRASDSSMLVLQGDSGESLAFGPGHMSISTSPGKP